MMMMMMMCFLCKLIFVFLLHILTYCTKSSTRIFKRKEGDKKKLITSFPYTFPARRSNESLYIDTTYAFQLLKNPRKCLFYYTSLDPPVVQDGIGDHVSPSWAILSVFDQFKCFSSQATRSIPWDNSLLTYLSVFHPLNSPVTKSSTFSLLMTYPRNFVAFFFLLVYFI